MFTRVLIITKAVALCLALLAAAWGHAQAAGDLAQLAQRIQERYQGIDSISADYTRSSQFVALGRQPGRQVLGQGHLVWARPFKLRLEQESPRQELIVAQQGVAWWVRPSKKRADIYPLNNFTTGLTSLLEALGGLARLDRDFTLGEPSPLEQNGIPPRALVLSLTPREQRADLKRLVLWFSADSLLLGGFKIINLVGDVTTYSLERVQVNQPVTPQMFAYEPPVDYRVKDHRPIRGQKAGSGR